MCIFRAINIFLCGWGSEKVASILFLSLVTVLCFSFKVAKVPTHACNSQGKSLIPCHHWQSWFLTNTSGFPGKSGVKWSFKNYVPCKILVKFECFYNPDFLRKLFPNLNSFTRLTEKFPSLGKKLMKKKKRKKIPVSPSC